MLRFVHSALLGDHLRALSVHPKMTNVYLKKNGEALNGLDMKTDSMKTDINRFLIKEEILSFFSFWLNDLSIFNSF